MRPGRANQANSGRNRPYGMRSEDDHPSGGGGAALAQPLARGTAVRPPGAAARDRGWGRSPREAAGEKRWRSRQISESSAVDDQTPVARPARNPAPSAV